MAESNQNGSGGGGASQQADRKKPARAEFLIITPKNPFFAGERAGLRFYEGQAKTSDAAAAKECARLGRDSGGGYLVIDLVEPPRFEIRAPAEDSAFTGERHGVFFFKGIGRTDDAKAVATIEAQDKGYEVLDLEHPKKPAAK